MHMTFPRDWLREKWQDQSHKVGNWLNWNLGAQFSEKLVILPSSTDLTSKTETLMGMLAHTFSSRTLEAEESQSQ